MIPIGLSTGTLYKFKNPLEEKLNSLLNNGATAVELVLITPQFLYEFELTYQLQRIFDRFNHVSIHAPFIMPNEPGAKSPFQRMLFDNGDETKTILDKLQNLSTTLNSQYTVFHPETVKDKAILTQYDLNIAMENMDKDKLEGIDPDYFIRMSQDYEFHYVLDLHHIFTHDPSMSMTPEYIKAMENKIVGLHVSGLTGEHGHLPIHVSENRDLIMKYAKLIKKPIILEGTLKGKDLEAEISAEIQFLKNELRV